MKRFFVALLVLVALVLALSVSFVLGLGFWLSPQDRLEKSDAIIAISGGDTTARTLEAIKLYEAEWAPKIIFSGAALDPNSPSNARAMQIIAIKAGVPKADILLDESSVNTIQNAADVATIVKANGFTKVILVTSPYHQRRASVTFAAALGKEVTIINHSTTDHNWRRARWWATDYSYDLTVAELKKILYTLWREYQQPGSKSG